MILAGLVRLALLRALRPALCLFIAGLLAWALATSRVPTTALLAAGSDQAPLWEHGAQRASAWTITLLVCTGWLGLQALLVAAFAYFTFGPLANLALWAFAEQWYFPYKLPLVYGFKWWEHVFRPTSDAVPALVTSSASSCMNWYT